MTNDDPGGHHLSGDLLAAWTTGLAWAEHRSWAMAGPWSTAATIDGVTATLAPISAHHGRRADQLRTFWPQRRGGTDGAASPAGPPTPDDGPLLDLANALDEAQRSLGPPGETTWTGTTSMAALRLTAQLILPRFLTCYKQLLKLANAPSDASIRRICELALTDTTADFVTATAKLAALGENPGPSQIDDIQHAGMGQNPTHRPK